MVTSTSHICVVFLQRLFLLLDGLLLMEEIQDKWRESMFIVSQPSSCEEHFLLPPLFYSYQIYVWMNLRAPPLLLLFMDGV